ncbi:MAG: flagellar hook-basal body complex protein [Clostridiales bacterium]|nr:flagellar hook-basal body complex protein [Clostridiales bacterium]
MQSTSRSLDVAIDGEGYFMVGKGPTIFEDNSIQVNHQPGTHTISNESLTNSKMQINYTRDGSFTLDSDGNLLTSDGYRVLGYSLTNDLASMDPTAQSPNVITAGGFNFAFGPGASLNGYSIVLGKVGPDTVASAEVDTISKRIILNGDFSKPNGITSEQAASAINKALNAAGIPQTVSVSGENTAISGLKSGVTGNSANILGLTISVTEPGVLDGYSIEIGNMAPGASTSATVDTKYKKIIINGDFTTSISDADIEAAINQALQNKAIGNSANVVTVTGGPTTPVTGTVSGIADGGTPVQSIDEDGVINFVDATKEVKSYDGSLKTLRIPDKVRIPGENVELRIISHSISKDGLISGVLEDGRVAALGQIAMASFKNPAGLTKMGNNLYTASVNSGEATIRSGIGTLGEDNSQGYGDALQGMLEASNVDLAEQFTEMIVTSRAFQAAGKMITTGDEILQDIINLKR